MPPMPPPITATALGRAAGSMRYLRDCMVRGSNAQRAMPRVSGRVWALAWPLKWERLKHPLWQQMQGRISSSRSSRSLVTHSPSAGTAGATPMASMRPSWMARAAVSGSMRPAHTTGMSTTFRMAATSSRLQFSGMYMGGWDQYQES